MVDSDEIRVLLIAEQSSAKVRCLEEMTVEARRSVHTTSSWIASFDFLLHLQRRRLGTLKSAQAASVFVVNSGL